MSEVHEEIGRGFGRRLRELQATIDRYANFAFRPSGAVAHAPEVTLGEEQEAAWDVLRRALATLGDTLALQLARRLAHGDTGQAELAVCLKLPRMVVWERVNDLVQAGLAARALDGDQVGLTQAGQGMLRLFEQIVAAAVPDAASSGTATVHDRVDTSTSASPISVQGGAQ